MLHSVYLILMRKNDDVAQAAMSGCRCAVWWYVAQNGVKHFWAVLWSRYFIASGCALSVSVYTRSRKISQNAWQTFVQDRKKSR